MTLNFPDFETMILERLHKCNQEIVADEANKLKRAFEVFPVKPIPTGDLPALCVLYGRQEQPNTSAPGGGIEVIRPYTITIVIMPLDQGMDEGDKGAEPIQRSKGTLAAVRSYYLTYPLLQTSTLGPLQYMCKELTFLDSGLIAKKGPGGDDYLAIDCTLSISMRAKNPKKY